jgi:hypothetical protein
MARHNLYTKWQLGPQRGALSSETNTCSANQEIPSIYGTRGFITVFTKAHTTGPYFEQNKFSKHPPS